MSTISLSIPQLRSIPPECLECIVYHASQDHRVLSTLMQVNSTLFRMATPYLYSEPFKFIFGDEFLLDWDTETWTRHLREIRYAKLLLLYLSCSETVQSLLNGKERILSLKRNSITSLYHNTKDQSKSDNHYRSGQSSPYHTILEPDIDFRSAPTSPPIEHIPYILEKLLRSQYPNPNSTVNSFASVSPLRRQLLKRHKSLSSMKDKKAGISLGSTVNYLDYVEHLDLDSFLSSSTRVLFSPSSSTGNDPMPSSFRAPSQRRYSIKGNIYTCERAFIERVLLRSTAHHITTLSISVATFVRVQRDLMEYVLDPASSSASSSSSSATTYSSSPVPPAKNNAGLRTGMPLSQLSRLNISGLHAELKPKVLRAIRWFIRRHVAVYPGILTAISFEGSGDKIVNRRRQRNRNVVGVEPIQPGVIHFNNQNVNNHDEDDDDDDDDTEDEIDEDIDHITTHHNYHGQTLTLNQLQQQNQLHQNQHSTLNQFNNNNYNNNSINHPTNNTGYINNIPLNINSAEAPTPVDAFPAVFHSQYYLLSRNPDESCEIDFMGILKELYGQLEIVDLSQWSWSVITQQALEMIPISKLSTLRFHPRTRIQWRHGQFFLKDCPALKVLEIHAFDPKMLDLSDFDLPPAQDSTVSDPDDEILPATPLNPGSLTTLSLTGSVPNVLPAVRDAIRTMGKSLDTINLGAHLDGFLSAKQTQQLMDWSTSLSTHIIPQLTTLQLHGHLALSFDAPLLLEMCPSLRNFGLTIKSYTSSSFVTTELARVLPRFMVPWESNNVNHQCSSDLYSQKFQLRVLELQGPWILTDRDMDQIGEQICGLTTLNLVGCRFRPTTTPRSKLDCSRDDNNITTSSEENCFGEGEILEEDEEEHIEEGGAESEKMSSIARLVEKIQGTLRVLRIHRRGLEIKPRRDSSSYSYYSSLHSNVTSPNLQYFEDTCIEPVEPVLEFKKQFPNVKLQIQEKQHEHSFVIAPSADILRRIRRSGSPTAMATVGGRRNSFSLSDLWEHQGTTLSSASSHSGHNSVWRRARNAMPFLNSFGKNRARSRAANRFVNSYHGSHTSMWSRRPNWSRNGTP
ncbi:hypothetical protein BGZ76_004484, partial [Entomortierella beljakovae]